MMGYEIRRFRKQAGFCFATLVLILLGVSFGSAHAVTLVHSNDVAGELEPCGCRTNPQGGMARKYHLVKKIKDPFVIQVDSGDLLFPSEILPELLQEQAKVQAGFLVQSYNLTGQNVAVPGEKDFALGFKTFEILRKKAKFKYLAANLFLKDGKPAFPGHAILEGKDNHGKKVKVGIFGVVGEHLHWPKELKATPAFAAAKKEVEILRPQVDYLVAVTHQGVPLDEKMLKDLKGIDVLVSGHSQTFMQEPHHVGKTYLLESSFRNQYVGIMPLTTPIQIKDYKLEGLDANYDSPAGSPSEMDNLVSEMKQSIAKLNSKLEDALENEQAEKMTSGEQLYYHTMPKCAQCHLVQFDFWRKTKHARALDSLLDKKEAQNKECLQCHTVGLGHNHGFKDVNSLAQIRIQAKEGESEPRVQTLNAEQLAYVLRGFRDAGSYKSTMKIQEKDSEKIKVRDALAVMDYSWAPVQCENCHQPGRGHPFSGKYTKTVAENACIRCHTVVRAPEWYEASGQPKWDLIKEKRKMITCPAGDITPEDAGG